MRLTFTILFCFSLTRLLSQSPGVESMLTKPLVDCETVYNNALEVIPQLYSSNQVDSVVRAIHFWETVCGVTEASQRVKILIAIHNRNFSELLYTDSIIDHIQSYHYLQQYLSRRNWRDSPRSQTFARLSSYNHFTTGLATSLLKVADTTSLEYFFCRLYANQTKPDEFPDDIKFANTKLLSAVKNRNIREKESPKGHASLMAGIWIPTGKASLLGNHPEIAGQLGIKKSRTRFDLHLAFRFINSANTYLVRRDNQFYDSDHYFGGLVGLEYGREIVSRKKSYLEIIVGAGGDGFDVFNSDRDDADYLKPLSIWSYNVNGGLQYNFKINNNTLLGIRSQYHLINYRNKGGTDMSGNAFTAGLVVGFLSPQL